jgi:hypothetical protein
MDVNAAQSTLSFLRSYTIPHQKSSYHRNPTTVSRTPYLLRTGRCHACRGITACWRRAIVFRRWGGHGLSGILWIERVCVALADAVEPFAAVLAVVGAVLLLPWLGVHGAVGTLGHVVDGEDIGVEKVLRTYLKRR